MKTFFLIGLVFIAFPAFAKKPHNKPVINQAVAREHQKLFRPSPILTAPGTDYVSQIEQLGRPTWKHGRWIK